MKACVVHLIPGKLPARESTLSTCVLNKTLAPDVPLVPVDVNLLWNNFPEPSKKDRRVEGSEKSLTHSGTIVQAFGEKTRLAPISREINKQGW